MHMRLLKSILHIPHLFSEIQVTFGSFVKPFSAITQGELEPQFASKTPALNRTLNKFTEVIGRSKKIHEHHI